MTTVLLHVYRLSCALLAGGQLFFATVAAQVVFPRDVAALPRGDARRQLAADLVGGMLARLDAATISISALAVLCAVLVSQRKAAILPLLAGLCATVSMAVITPKIHAMREAGETGLPRFGLLHAVSACLLIAEVIILVVAAVRAPESAR